MPADLVTYLLHDAPRCMTWSQLRSLVALRRAHGRPLSPKTYATIRLVLLAHDVDPVG